MSNKASHPLFVKASAQASPPPKKNQTRAAALSEINFPISDKGFTLIELLVVIAILSLLISILLPSLNKAKELAYETVCTSNLRQIGTAWEMYLVDSGGTFPMWEKNMQYFYGGKHPSIGNALPNSTLPTLHYRPLNPYVDMKLKNESGTGLFRCPVDREITHPGGEVADWQGYNTYDFFGNSYLMNHNLLRTWDEKAEKFIPFLLGYAEISTSMLVVAGGCQWYYSLPDSQWDANFHNYDDRVGLVFMDGHAGFIQLHRGAGGVTDDYSFSPYWPEEEEEEEGEE